VELEEAFAARSKEILTAKRMFNEKQLGFLNKASSRSYIEELVNSEKLRVYMRTTNW
jgi:hypothetical protein